MTYHEAFCLAAGELAELGVPDPQTDAWYLLEYVSGMSRTSYLLKKQKEISAELLSRYRTLVCQRGMRIPLQYLTGEQEFMGLTFHVNDQVLIPRQDTEILVEEALKRARSGMRLLDLCTGSGCIAISLVKLCPGLTGIGADLSEYALEMARKNAQLLKVSEEQLSFRTSDLYEQIPENFDLIVSNPPYIPTSEIETLMPEVRLFEPRMALDGSEDGLLFYRNIIAGSAKHLNLDGWLMFEVGCNQGEAVSAMMKENRYAQVQVVKDLSGLDRVVLGRREL